MDLAAAHQVADVRRVDQQQARFGRDGGGDLGKVRAEGFGRERHAHRHATGQLDIGYVAVVARVEHDDLIARADAAEDDGQNGLRGTGGDGDFAGGVVAPAVQRFDLLRHHFAQRGHARHRRVLVVAGLHGAVHAVEQGRVATEIRKALAQVDSFVLVGQRRHDGEDGGAHMGQAAREARGESGGRHGWRVLYKDSAR